MSYDVVALVANISLALSLFVALIFGIVEVRVAARDRRERLTLEALRNFQTREFAELIGQINFHRMPLSFAEFLSLTLPEQAKFIQFAQEMESLGMLVAEKYIKIDLVDKTLGSFVTTSWQKYKIIFTEIRREQPDPFLGEYFQWLAEQIEDRMKNYPRKPYYENRTEG
jgi:hypothetical protein